jgi:hypothetical protein
MHDQLLNHGHTNCGNCMKIIDIANNNDQAALAIFVVIQNLYVLVVFLVDV